MSTTTKQIHGTTVWLTADPAARPASDGAGYEHCGYLAYWSLKEPEGTNGTLVRNTDRKPVLHDSVNAAHKAAEDAALDALAP